MEQVNNEATKLSEIRTKAKTESENRPPSENIIKELMYEIFKAYTFIYGIHVLQICYTN